MANLSDQTRVNVVDLAAWNSEDITLERKEDHLTYGDTEVGARAVFFGRGRVGVVMSTTHGYCPKATVLIREQIHRLTGGLCNAGYRAQISSPYTNIES